MKRLSLLLGVLLCSIVSWAQFTQVTGTVTDPNGLPYANGTITPVLVISTGTPVFTATGRAYTPPTQPTGLNTSGSFQMQLADNTQLSPAASKWNFIVTCSSGCVLPAGGKGPISFTLAAPITISGASQSISANLNAVAPALSIPSASGSTTFNNVLAGTSTAALLIGTGGSLGVTGSGTIAATTALTATSASSVPFSGLTTGTSAVALLIGTGGSLGVTGSGTIAATSTPFSGTLAGTSTVALVIGSGGSLSATGSGTIAATSVPIAGVTGGTSTQAFLIGTGGSLGVSGTGTIAATSAPFAGIAAGTNTAALLIGTGGSLGVSGTGTIAATTSLGISPAGGQGQSYVNVNGGTTLVTSIKAVYASQFAGSDPCAQSAAAGQANQTSSPAINGAQGKTYNTGHVMFDFSGQINCVNSPVAGWHGGGEWDAGSYGTIDIRISNPIALPGGINFHGQGPAGGTVSANGQASNYYNTIIRACNTKIFAGCSPDFSAAIPTDTILSIGAVGVGCTLNGGLCAVVNAANTLLGTQEVVIPNTGGNGVGNNLGVTGVGSQSYSSPILGTSTYPTATPACTAGTSGNCIAIAVPAGYAGCASNCGLAYEATAVVYADFTTYRILEHDFTIDCAFVIGCIPWGNSSAEENWRLYNVNTVGSGTDELGRISTTSGPFGTHNPTGGGVHSAPIESLSGNAGVETCELNSGSNNCFTAFTSGCVVSPTGTGTGGFGCNVAPTTPCSVGSYPSCTSGGPPKPSTINTAGVNPYSCDTRGLVIDGTGLGGPIFGARAFTLNSGDLSASVAAGMTNVVCGGSHDPIGILIFGGGGASSGGASIQISDFHIEWYVKPIEIGGNSAVNPDIANYATSSVAIHQFEVCCGSGTGSNVDIGPNAFNIRIGDWFSGVDNTFPLSDANSGINCNYGEQSEAWFYLANNNHAFTSCTDQISTLGALALSDLAPVAVTTGTGTNAPTILNAIGITGGGTSNATGIAGTGSSIFLAGGAGGAGTGTNAVGGAGGGITFTAGNGGASNGTGVNAAGGNITFVAGAAGTGGSGAAGTPGTVIFPNGSCAAGAGNAPGFKFADNSVDVGFVSNAATTITFCSAGNKFIDFNGLGIELGSTRVYQFGSGGGSSTATDTGVSRDAADVVALGNGTQGDETALLRAGNICHPTSALTLSTTQQAICTWTLPAVAKTWYWSCEGIYSITAGTLPTFQIGMNASQAPSTETGSASINTTLTGTSTQQTTTATAAGNQPILTGQSVTTIANGQWESFGTIQASATGGTFSVTGLLGGTTPAGTVNVGSGCTLN